MNVRRKFLFFGGSAAILIAVLAFALVREMTTTSAAGPFALGLSVTGAGSCTGGPPPTSCTVPTGAAFTLNVNSLAPPAEGYISFQDFIDYGANVTYNKGVAADEIVWPQGNGFQVSGQTCVPSTCVNHGATSAVIPPFPVSNFIGVLTALSFNCSAGNTTSTVKLLPEGAPNAASDGTVFVRPNNTHVVPKEHDLTLTCGTVQNTPTNTSPAVATATNTVPAGPTATATATAVPGTPTATVPVVPSNTPTRTATSAPPTNTPTRPPSTNTPTRTPTREEVLGDVNGDGVTDSADGLLIMQHEAGLRSLPNPSKGDINGDGVINVIDALFALWIDADLFP